MGQLKILLVGAEGFVGSNALNYLSQKHTVVPIYKSHNIDFSLLQPVKQLLEQVQPDVVLNCLTYGFKHTVERDEGAEAAKNIAMFYNFYHNSHLFKQYINIGSGAEFDRRLDINNVTEGQIYNCLPVDAYGFAKNVIARVINSLNDKFVTLRLFGCFGPNEWETRFFKRFVNSQDVFKIQDDRYFDYISIQDFVKVIDHVISNQITGQDFNCVYNDKLLLSEILTMFCDVHNLEKRFEVGSTTNLSYTGSASKINYSMQQLELDGLVQGMKDYL